MGRVVSEYETKTAGSEVGIKYLTQDHLGSTRIVTDVSKQVKGRYDYLPFGEEIGSSIGGRTTVGGYTPAESTRQKFTGKERDKESGLDYFIARYYSSVQGRFMTTDPIVVTPDRFFDPQQFNAYAYVRNNPLRYIDPTGMVLTTSGNMHDARKLLREMLGVEDAEKRLSYDTKTNTITVDLSGIDLSKNEGAALLNDVISSKNHYDLSIGPTVESLGGEVDVPHITNLDNNPDNRYNNRKPPGKVDTEKPKAGVDDQVAINLGANLSVITKKGEENLAIPKKYTEVFHELAEAYEKVEHGKQYANAHEAALKREDRLREQRPYLKAHIPGGGSTRLKIKQ